MPNFSHIHHTRVLVCNVFAMTLLSLVFFTTEVQADNFTLNNKREIYRYEPVFTYDDSGKINSENGQIHVTNTQGEDVFIDLTGYLPGCGDELAPITIIGQKVAPYNLSKEQTLKQFVAFCGNTGGRHYTLRLYQPFLGMVASLDFLDGPVDFTVDPDGVYSARTFNQIYLKSLRGMVYFPTYYRLNSVGGSVAFSSKQTIFSSSFYKKYIDAKIKSFQKDKNLIQATQVLITSIQMEDEDTLCENLQLIISLSDSENHDMIKKIYHELQDEFTYVSKCEKR